jgi:hypothetical protein
MSNISSIDDLLMGVGNSQQPATPEHKDKIVEDKAPIEEVEAEETPDYGDVEEEKPETVEEEEVSDETPALDSEVDEEDEYGNKKERMSKGMKERLDRKEKQYQRDIDQRDHELQVLRQQLASKGASSEVQKAAADFKYDPNDEGSWQTQLTDFVKQTVNSMTNETQQRERAVKEEQVQREFHKKFTTGMDRFQDFKEVVGAQPMDDAMTLSLRAMADPTAFIYAASKRHPQEIERISKLPDPYARMVEMGKLEERMRRNKSTTKTPRPLGRTREDAVTKVQPKQKDTSGDDLLAKADAKRLATVKTRHKANR